MVIVLEVSGRAGRVPRVFAWFLRQALHGMVTVDRAQIRRGEVTGLYDSGVTYADEPGTERIQDALTTMVRGTGDCAHLCAWRVAELREAGEDARIRIKWFPVKWNGQRTYHVQVRRGDGTIEDPSKILGMGKD